MIPYILKTPCQLVALTVLSNYDYLRGFIFRQSRPWVNQTGFGFMSVMSYFILFKTITALL